jgi:hypothetical protein
VKNEGAGKEEDGMNLGNCAWCEREAVEIFDDNKLCAECDGRIVYCQICDELVCEDDLCRHLFRNDNYEWSGSGSRIDADTSVKKSFQSMLASMPEEFAAELREAILSGKFYTWLTMPLIGSGAILDLNGMMKGLAYGRILLEIGRREDQVSERLRCGFQWMASLYENATTNANKITIEWIDSFLTSAKGGSIGTLSGVISSQQLDEEALDGLEE